jgi:DNA topoisomerase-2
MTTTETEISNKYQQKNEKQHILDNPDTYIGSVEIIDSPMWVLEELNNEIKIVEKNIKYIPGLFKLFDEGIVNCRDHFIRMQQAIKNNTENTLPVTFIDITIESNGNIIMMNDGNGIDIVQHPEYNIWIPELIFGHLRTSTNYNKNEKKIVGGKNGFGFKLALVWSTIGSVETVDHIRGLKYKQEFKNNLDVICPPEITSFKNKKPYTKVTFTPDYKRFGINNIDADTIALLKKRVYDVAAVTDKTLKVKYNSIPIPVKTFKNYTDLYLGNTEESNGKKVYEENGERWEYLIALSPTHEFIQVSFVNGIHTSKGGKHVEYILNQVTRKLIEYIEKKKKIVVNSTSIKEQIILFLKCDIENPAFDSQTKDYMNTPSSKFGSSCIVSDKFIEKLAKIGIMDSACALTELKENKMSKKTDGVKTKNVKGIPKLIDANWAGTEKSKHCTIIFCEGDSAKAGIVSGLSSEDRNIFGVYPMKGKILNVRGETTKKINENKEISEIKKILGLETGKEYTSIEQVHKALRYSKVLFITDQDLDGSHIKGLCINLFLNEWPSLSKIPNFISFMNTPILRAQKGNKHILFYNDGEYEEWKDFDNMDNSWKIKYFKGLGTSTSKEFKSYFESKKIVGFQHSGDICDNSIDMVFNKKRACDRKDWLSTYNRKIYLDTNNENVSYTEFINKELIHFSKYDCDRNIPNIMDGFKTSLRKIIYSAFKKNLITEIKVAQFTGYVSEHSGYHHGEASLNSTIIGMAQNFVGSNNINLLMPNGQFGSRLQGGQDSASERYIYTQLNNITRYIIPAADDNILQYLNDDGTMVEPLYYAPIIPMILVNGSKGIGTGFSTEILCYNPLDIIEYINNKLLNKENNIKFIPYYEGFLGTIQEISSGKFIIKGKYEVIGDDKIRVLELPVGFWTDNFKELLELLSETTDKDGKKIQPYIKEYNDMSKDTNIDFVITFHKGKLQDLLANNIDYNFNLLEKTLKLYTNTTTTNMHLFDAEDNLKKYETVENIIDDYYSVRLSLYDTRKKYLISQLENELIVLINKSNYIQENINNTINLMNKKKQDIINTLTEKGYAVIDNDTEFKYLIKMPMDSVTEENASKLLNDAKNKKQEIEDLKNITITQMWLNELELLKNKYILYKKERNGIIDIQPKLKKNKINKK